jgi:hypothetical protein
VKKTTTNYRHWSGKLVEGVEDVGVVLIDDKFYMDPIAIDDAGWQYLGIAPRPTSRWEWLCFDYRHGRLMGYPLLSVLAFCWYAWKNELRKWSYDNPDNSAGHQRVG